MIIDTPTPRRAPEPWQCPRCGRWQGPHTERCDCTPDPRPPYEEPWPDPWRQIPMWLSPPYTITISAPSLS